MRFELSARRCDPSQARTAALVVTLATFAFGVGHADVPMWDEVAAEKQAARGVQAGQLNYQVGGAEVNAFNFNFMLNLSEQIGFSTPVDGGLSVTLNRVYNSKLEEDKTWLRHNECSLAVGNPWNATYTPTNLATPYLSVPRQNPMGLGWQFHLGHVYRRESTQDREYLRDLEGCWHADHPLSEPYQNSYYPAPTDAEIIGYWTYVAPDGSEHQLIPAPAENQAPEGEELGHNFYYSRDGSRIRAKEFTDGNFTVYWEVYLPDGRKTATAGPAASRPTAAAAC